MVTTIQVSEKTMEQLKKMKQSQGLGSYDEVVQELILKSKSQRSLFGFLGTPQDSEKMFKYLKEERKKSG